jgi:hypothetical protein
VCRLSKSFPLHLAHLIVVMVVLRWATEEPVLARYKSLIEDVIPTALHARFPHIFHLGPKLVDTVIAALRAWTWFKQVRSGSR